MANFFEWLEHTPWVVTYSATGWMYASTSILHYFSLFVLVGSILIVDLRLLGVAARRQSVTQVAEQFFPWIWAALAVALLSGSLMFTASAGDFYLDLVFRIKMTVVLLGLIVAIIIQRNIYKWDAAPVISTRAKIVALISIVLWVGAILAGVDVAAYSGLG